MSESVEALCARLRDYLKDAEDHGMEMIPLARNTVREIITAIGRSEETWTDEKGTAWRRPTAWAYAQVCAAHESLRTQIAALRAENRRLRGAILWALGYADFPEQPTGKGRYWWRTELAQRAAIGDDAASEAKP